MATAEQTKRPKLVDLAERIGQQRHLMSIRDGVVAALPLVLVGSLFVLIGQPPVPSWNDYIGNHPQLLLKLLLPYRMILLLLSVYVCFAVAHALAKRYDLDPLAGGLMGVMAFMVATSGPWNLVPVIKTAGNAVYGLGSAGALGTPAFPAARLHGMLAGQEKTLWAMPMEWLGPQGMFVGMILAIFAVEMQRVFVKRNWVFRMPAGVPDSVLRSFIALAPTFFVVVVVWVVVHVLGINLFGYVALAIKPLLVAAESVPGLLAIVLIDSVIWLLGIHPLALMAPVQAIWLVNIGANQTAHEAGQPMVHLATREFFIWFVWLGGSGVSLCLPFLYLRARSAALRGIAKVGIPTTIFNINDPVVFGTPLVMNLTVGIPFVLAPVVCTMVAWAALKLHLVTIPYLIVPWTLPAPIGAYFSTGGDWKAIVLVAVNLAIATVMYIPFVRAYDRRLAAQEEQVKGES